MKLEPLCLLKLDELLHDIYVAGRPSSNNYDSRRELIRAFHVMAREVYGRHDDFPVVEAYGSFIMDMFSNESDLDLSVNFSSDSAELPRHEKIKALRKFKTKLFQLQIKGHLSGVNPVLKAKVPIVKVVDCRTGIECDISVENKDGILKSQFVLIVSDIDGRFHKLSSLMKAWAKANDINSSKDRTLNSLAIILLVAFHLQTREPPILPPFSLLLKDGIEPENVKKVVQEYLHYGKGNKESVAELFVTLLSKLASVEDQWREGLCASTYEGSWISKTWDSKVGCISVEDFMDRAQNVARAVGPDQAEVIFECVNNSLLHLWDFAEGKIQGHELRGLLFGDEQILTVNEYLLSHKRSSDLALSTLYPKKLTKRQRRTLRKSQLIAELKMEVGNKSIVTEGDKTVYSAVTEEIVDSVVTEKEEKTVVTENEEKTVVVSEKEKKIVSVLLPRKMTEGERRLARKAKLEAHDPVVTKKEDKIVDSVEKKEKKLASQRPTVEKNEKKVASRRWKIQRVESVEARNQRYAHPENPSFFIPGSQFPRFNIGNGQVDPWRNQLPSIQTINGGGHYWSPPVRQWNSWGSPRPPVVPQFAPPPPSVRPHQFWEHAPPPVATFPLSNSGGPPPTHMFPPPSHLIPPHVSAQQWNSLPSQSQAAPFHHYPHPHPYPHPDPHRYF